MGEIRPLLHDDYFKGYLELLNSLSICQNFTLEQFTERFNQLQKNEMIKIYVMEKDDKIVASATCLIEPKFIHNGGKVAHIEDVVVSPEQRGKGLGQILINHLIEEARKNQCYKVILDCHQELSAFYQKSGFFVSGLQMRINMNR